MQEFQIQSQGGGQLRCGLWTPEGGAKAVVQIIHGIAEHIGRYDRFLADLAARGFIAFGHDHLGHGHTVSDSTELGHIADKNGCTYTSQIGGKKNDKS